MVFLKLNDCVRYISLIDNLILINVAFPPSAVLISLFDHGMCRLL